ncbi:hypothetical protein DB88DRAFT_72651 [Papiliotrema laurentii]|uniref:Mid2 domain-containing protein n=1 Tax=Papiliotrema laurentii TaxID=5418 RepID=A0AAD9FQ41_PAPLA|nr:hypothetical protein DB88DRAFT_72651 [Papiliotrema laurentii]
MRASSSFPLFVVLWATTLWTHAFAQLSSAKPSATSSTTTLPSPTASLTFATLPTVTACSSTPIRWVLSGNDVSQYNITVQAIGTTGNSSSSQATQPIYQQVATQPAVSMQTDYLVKLPPGRYYLHGRVSDPSGTSANSALFWVVQGKDSSCLNEDAVSASSSSTASGTSTPHSAVASHPASSSASSGAAAGAAVGSSSGSKSGISTGAIVGIAIGAVAGIVGLILAILFCIRRRKHRDVEASNPDMASRASSGFGDQFPTGSGAFAGDRGSRESRHGGHHGRNDGHNEGHFVLSSMGDSAEGGEKDEGPFVGSYGSEASTTLYLAHGPNPVTTATRPSTPPQGNPFASVPTTPRTDDPTAAVVGVSPVPGVPPSVKENRRQSQPSPKSPHSLSDRSRSNSQPSNGPSGQVGVMRTPSARRKPVPSLGAELREELRNETSQRQLRETARRQGGAGTKEELEGPSQKETLRSSYQLMPDPPRPINE